MARLKSITFVSLVVIVASVAVLLLVPVERDRVRSALVNAEFDARLREQARAHPNDAQIWLALAAGSIAPFDGLPRTMDAFDQLFKLKPRWAVPHLVLGTDLARRGRLVRVREFAALYADDPGRPRPTGRPLTKEQREALKRAIMALETARSLDSQNAAPDYLLAYLALVEHRDGNAVALLRSGLRKNRWDLGRRDVTIACYDAYRHTMPQLEAGFDAMFGAYVFHGGMLRELARVVTDMAVLAQQRGDDEQAIFLRESMMHLGALVMTNGYTLIDVLSGGVAVWRISVGTRLTPEENAMAVSGVPEPKPHESGERRARWYQALEKAQGAKFVVYLRAHGRADLAERITVFAREHRAWSRRALSATNASDARLFRTLRVLSAFRQALIGAGGALGLLVLCGLACLALRAAGRRPAPMVWARWKWALVVVGCLIVTLGGGMALLRGRWWSSPMPGFADETTAAPWGRLFVLAALPLMVLSTLLIVWVVRRRSAAADRPGFVRQYVATLGAVLAPLVAILLLGCVVMSVPVAIRANDQARRFRIMVYRGELAYLGLKPPMAK